MNRILSVLLLTFVAAAVMDAHGGPLVPEKRWLHGVIVNKGGEPVLFVEYQEPYAGLDGEYFWLEAAPGLEKELSEAIHFGESLHVLAEYEADYSGKVSPYGGFLFEAKVLKIGKSWSSEIAKPARGVPPCERNLYEIFDIPQNLRPERKR